jgi:hypothetical protein
VSVPLCVRTELIIGTEALSESPFRLWFGLFTLALSSLRGMYTFDTHCKS